MINTRPTVYFSHGKESGPWGTKITVLAAGARKLGHPVESIDYTASLDPDWRVRQLLETARPNRQRCILVGSSMGAYVATAAAAELRPRGLFLMAPAFYLQGYQQQTPAAPDCPVSIVHGWKDEVVPVDNAIRFARRYRTSLHLIDSDHGLNDSLPVVGELFGQFLQSLQLDGADTCD